MKKIQKSLSIAATTAAVAATLTTPAAFGEITDPASVTTVNPEKDGREIAEAMLFSTGSYADDLEDVAGFETINDQAANSTPEGQEIISLVLDEIEQNEEGFFTDLHENMRSGDPYKVSESVSGLTEAIHTISEESTAVVAQPTSEGEIPQAFVIVAVFHVGGLATALAAAAFEFVAIGHAYVYAQTEFWAASQVQQESIADLTTIFAE